MRGSQGRARLWIAIVSVCTFTGWLAGCTQLSSAAGEGSSLPPSKARLTSSRLPIFRSMIDAEFFVENGRRAREHGR